MGSWIEYWLGKEEERRIREAVRADYPEEEEELEDDEI